MPRHEGGLLVRLRSHPAQHGPIREWTGRSADSLHETTEERVEQIERELSRIEATIEFVTALQKALDSSPAPAVNQGTIFSVRSALPSPGSSTHLAPPRCRRQISAGSHPSLRHSVHLSGWSGAE